MLRQSSCVTGHLRDQGSIYWLRTELSLQAAVPPLTVLREPPHSGQVQLSSVIVKLQVARHAGDSKPDTNISLRMEGWRGNPETCAALRKPALLSFLRGVPQVRVSAITHTPRPVGEALLRLCGHQPHGRLRTQLSLLSPDSESAR